MRTIDASVTRQVTREVRLTWRRDWIAECLAPFRLGPSWRARCIRWTRQASALLLWLVVGLAGLGAGCAGSPTGPSTVEGGRAPRPVITCRTVVHPEVRETRSVLIGGRLQFVVIVTPSWEEVVCQ